jgi:hypothetical protein
MREVIFHRGRADLALTAGRLDTARESLGLLEAQKELGLQHALRLALSAGSNADDRVRLRKLLDRKRVGLAPEHIQLLALVVAQAEGWKQREWLKELVAAGDLAAVGTYVVEPTPEALAGARANLSRLGLGARWAAELALSGALEESAPAEAAALRRDATRLGLPGELPYLGI